MKQRKGEKIGWIGGWLGSYLWILFLGIYWILSRDFLDGVLMLLLFTIGSLVVLSLQPWKFPNTKYRKLMLPNYAVFFVSLWAIIESFGGYKVLKGAGINWWNFSWLIGIFIPLFTIGKLTWNMDKKN